MKIDSNFLFQSEKLMLKHVGFNLDQDITTDEIKNAASELFLHIDSLYRKSCKHQLCYHLGVGKIGRIWALASKLDKLPLEIETRIKIPNC